MQTYGPSHGPSQNFCHLLRRRKTTSVFSNRRRVYLWWIGGDAVPPPLEITVIADNGGKVVLKEHRTAKESWDAKQNREYLMSARQLATGDGERGVHQGAFTVKAP